MDINPKQIISDFIKVAFLAGVLIAEDDLSVQLLPAPHTPPTTIPYGKMAIYMFLWGDLCLKIGKAGHKSKARFTNQHYNPESSNSNLAKSILKYKDQLKLANLDDTNISEWIKKKTSRVNFYIDKKLGIFILNLLESFLQCRFKPFFEGFDSQR